MSVISFSSQTKYLTVKQVAARYSLGVSTIWQWAKEGKFPQPRKLHNATRWYTDDLTEWESEMTDSVVNQ